MKPVARSLVALTTLGLSIGSVNGLGNELLGSRVSRLVDQTTESKESESQAIKELESLDSQAVPYLVSHLGDLRPLADPEIVLSNKGADTFESARHYTPDNVHDALSAILNQITGQNFVFVYNGATPAERVENRQKWVDWCRSVYSSQAAVCNDDRK
jgi:hypothetical protein